jgi:hypothetical protein
MNQAINVRHLPPTLVMPTADCAQARARDIARPTPTIFYGVPALYAVIFAKTGRS